MGTTLQELPRPIFGVQGGNVSTTVTIVLSGSTPAVAGGAPPVSWPEMFQASQSMVIQPAATAHLSWMNGQSIAVDHPSQVPIDHSSSSQIINLGYSICLDSLPGY